MLVERNCISLEQRCNNLVHLVVCLEHYTTVRGNRRSFQGKAVVAVKSTDRYLVGKLYHKGMSGLLNNCKCNQLDSKFDQLDIQLADWRHTYKQWRPKSQCMDKFEVCIHTDMW